MNIPSTAAGRLRPSGSKSGTAALPAAVRGRVDFGPGARALYAADDSNYRQVPLGVVVPESVDVVLAAVGACADRETPVLCRGGGTAMAGQTANAAVVLDFSRHLNGVLELDPDARSARVQPGYVLDRLHDAAGEHGLTFGPDPATHDHCTLGGMIGNDSCGTHSVVSGRTSQNVQSLHVLPYDGLRLEVGATDEAELAAIMAGGDHHDVPIACAERIMAPAIREADQDTLVVVDGFSCRTQVEHTAARCALHLAEVLDTAITTGPYRRGVAANG